MTPFTIPIPTYQCHKRVQALRIKAVVPNSRGYELHFEDERFAPHLVADEWIGKHCPERGYEVSCDEVLSGGYLVIYEDGYMSWSPAAAFEAGYTLVDDAGGTDCSSPGWSAWLGGPSEVDAALASRDAEIERLRGLLRGCVEHMEYSTPQGGAAWDAANEEVGPSAQPTRSLPQPTTHLQTCPHCKAVFLADGVTTKE